MFIWDFVADTILEQIMDWVYKQIIGFLANFFAEMGNMGAEMFEMSWVQSIVLFFSYLAWILYAVGFVVACAECGLEYSSGRADIKGTAMNLIKGFMAVSLFTVVPIRLYELCVSLQANFGYAISGAGASFGTVAGNIIDELTVENFVDFATTHVGGFGSVTSPIMVLFCIILMAYAVIKVFFANLKRGGILLIQIAVGSLYMFSVPRGYLDGFYQWCKQVVGLCLTAFLQATILIAGLTLFNEHALLGLGLMLSAGAVNALRREALEKLSVQRQEPPRRRAVAAVGVQGRLLAGAAAGGVELVNQRHHGGDGRVVLHDRIVETLTHVADLVFGIFQLGLQVQEVRVRLQVGIGFQCNFQS